MEKNYAKFGNEEKTLSIRVRDAINNNRRLGERLWYDLYNARREDLDWDIFYNLIELPEEKESGFWLSARVATTLLGPIISMQFYKNQNARMNERPEDDFASEVLMEIARVIPRYDKSKAQFPHYISLYVHQCGYVHNKDSSVYLQKKKGIRIFSQNSLAGDGKEDGGTSADSYSQVAGMTSIEEEVESKEALRKSAVFNNVVIKKAFSGEHERKIHADVEQLMVLKDEARLLRMSNKEGECPENTERILNIEKLLEDAESKVKITDDWDKTVINATLWVKFLGGVESFDNLFIDKVIGALENEEMVR